MCFDGFVKRCIAKSGDREFCCPLFALPFDLNAGGYWVGRLHNLFLVVAFGFDIVCRFILLGDPVWSRHGVVRAMTCVFQIRCSNRVGEIHLRQHYGFLIDICMIFILVALLYMYVDCCGGFVGHFQCILADLATQLVISNICFMLLAW